MNGQSIYIAGIRFIIILVVFWFCVTGCSTNRPILGGPNKPAILKEVKNVSTFEYRNKSAKNYYVTVYKDASDKEAVRNQILSDLMTIIDSNYHSYEDNLRNDKSTQEFLADLATLGLTAAATVSGGEETKTILSAIATGVVGVNTAANKEYFQNNAIQALQLQMRAARSKVETSLIKGMKQSIKDYPLEAGIRDIVQYYYAGSLNDALISLVQNSGSEAKTNQAAASSARSNGNPPGQ